MLCRVPVSGLPPPRGRRQRPCHEHDLPASHSRTASGSTSSPSGRARSSPSGSGAPDGAIARAVSRSWIGLSPPEPTPHARTGKTTTRPDQVVKQAGRRAVRSWHGHGATILVMTSDDGLDVHRTVHRWAGAPGSSADAVRSRPAAVAGPAWT
jgi:hypothetical protein